MAKLNSKKKGNRGELECVHLLEDKFGKGRFKRSPSSGALTGGANREGSENLSIEAKITLASDIITPIDFRFVIEHKFYAEASFWDLFNESSILFDWFQQAEDDAKFVNKLPMLVVKYNYKQRIAYIQIDALAALPVFSVRGWNCYWFDDLLQLNNEWWFENGKFS